ncbi:MAG: tetratricopeptide repeat protein [Candidatus Omnitrophota bacterium]
MNFIDKYRHILSLLIVLVLGGLIYTNSLNGPPMFDDIGYISGNDKIRDIRDIRSIWKAWKHPSRFVGYLTFALNYHVHKMDVFGYHLVNVLIHLTNTLMVWLLVGLMFQTPRLRDDPLLKQRHLIAWITALLFAVHPMQTQAVSYMAQRFASLATLFYLTGVYFYVRGRMSSQKSFLFFFIAGLSALLGMFTKQITITLPVTALLFDVLLIRKREDPVRINRKVAGGLFLFLLIVPSIFSFNVIGILSIRHSSGSNEGDTLTNISYLLTQFRVICTYLKLMFFPIGQNLLYEFSASYSIFETRTFWCFLGLLGIFFSGVRCLRTNILMALGIFWFFITLSVESSIIVIKHVIFEHRMYLPSFGFFLFCAAALAGMFRSPKKCVVTVCVIGLTLSYLTYKRNAVWSDDIAMWEDVIQKSPGESRGYMNLGNAYMERAEWETALKFLTQAIECNPRNYAAYSNRGMAFFASGHPHKAIGDFNQALDVKDDYAEAYINRGNYYSYIKDYKKAIADYDKAISLNPASEEAVLNRGNKYFRLKDFDAALADYTRSVELSPNFVQGYTSRAEVYTYLKQFDLALDDYNRALVLDDRDPAAFYGRGNVYFKMGDLHLALDDYNKVLEISPQHKKARVQKEKLIYFLNKKKTGPVR